MSKELTPISMKILRAMGQCGNEAANLIEKQALEIESLEINAALTQDDLREEIKELRAALVEAVDAIEGAYDYVEDAINEYVACHGESFRPQRLQYIRDRKTDCDKALTRCREVLK